MIHISLIWVIAMASIVCMLSRPRQIPEAYWIGADATSLVTSGLLPWRQAMQGVWEGTDVYLFLTGMMLLSATARREGVFDWFATIALRCSGGSASRLFTGIYAIGIVVTVFYRMTPRRWS